MLENKNDIDELAEIEKAVIIFVKDLENKNFYKFINLVNTPAQIKVYIFQKKIYFLTIYQKKNAINIVSN